MIAVAICATSVAISPREIISLTAYPLLDTIRDPADLRKLDRKQLAAVADELREFIIESVSNTGGHFSSNLGTIELTVALHYVDRKSVG